MPRLIEFVAMTLRCVDQVVYGRIAVEETIDPAFSMVNSPRVGCIKLPSIEESIDQSPDRLGARR
jgi:hypothetical protein